MPAERIGMRDAREIIRLKFSGLSTHEIARRLGMATDSEIKAAFKRVLRLFETFNGDFATPADKGVALSMLMTSVARRALGFAPLHGFDAPVAGSGKSMLVEIASIVATGHGAIVMAQGETREEFEKRLGTVLMRGDAIIAIDNCDLPLEGETLNQALTQPMLQVRILGKSEMPKVLTAAVVCATGNNLLPKGDVVRRSIICRLDPKCARPELRQYDFKPIAYAKENRAQLVVDILTLLKAWHNKGRPFQPAELQSFENWSNTIRGCIIWLGAAFPDANLADPCLTMDRIRASDPVLTNCGSCCQRGATSLETSPRLQPTSFWRRTGPSSNPDTAMTKVRASENH
jgi:hypothetical protein